MCANIDGGTLDYKFRRDGVSSAATQQCELLVITTSFCYK